MSDFETCVTNCRIAQEANREIDDATARVIASLYHDGQASASYRFASTGGFDNATDLYRECFPSYATMPTEDRLLADMFGTYLSERSRLGATSAVPGWSGLWVR